MQLLRKKKKNPDFLILICWIYATLPDIGGNNTRLLTCQLRQHLPLMGCSLKPYLVMKHPYDFLFSNPIVLLSQLHLLQKTLKQDEHTCYHTISQHEALNWHRFDNHVIHTLLF